MEKVRLHCRKYNDDKLTVIMSVLRETVSVLLVSSGELTLEEFISGARDHPDIMDMLAKMMDLTNVLEIIIRGQQKKAVAS